MSDQKPIFRAEAVQQRARLQVPGSLVMTQPRWTAWAFWLLLVLVAAGLVIGTQIKIERHAEGATSVDEQGRVVVLVPAALAPEVAPGRPVDLQGSSAEVISSERELLYPPEVRTRYGIEVAVPSVAIVTSATATQASSGTARVLIESEPLIVALVPGLKALLGGDGG